MRFLALLLFVIIFAPSLATAASVREPAYRKVDIFRDGACGFGVNLLPDEAVCKKNYGRNWRTKCAAAPGRYGEIAKGVKTTPPIEGNWQWNDASSLIFVPKDETSVKPATRYEINLDNLFLPSSIKLDRKTVDFMTWPLAAKVRETRFMIDPAPEAAHRLVLSMRFNYPVPETFSIPQPVGADFGAPEVVWNDSRRELNLAWKIAGLPQEESVARIRFPGVAEIYENSGALFLSAGRDGGLSVEKLIPAARDIFNIKNMSIEPALNDNLDQEYDLIIETSLYVSPENLLKSLSIAQLPKYNSPEAVEPYNWQLSPGISREALKNSVSLKPVVFPSSVPRSRHKLRVKPEAGRYLIVAVDDGLTSSSGLKLARPFAEILRAPEQSANLGFLQPGHILPLGKNASLEIYSTNMERIRWEAIRASDPFLALIANGQYIFENGYSPNVNDFETVGERTEGEIKAAISGDGKAQYSSLDAGLLAGENGEISGLYLLTLKGYRGDEAVNSVSRLILATDLGLLVKRSRDGEYDCFVQSLSSGAPVAGAEVRILAANGKDAASGATDKDGRASFSGLAGLRREACPVAVVVTKGEQLAWLPLEDRSRKADYSAFPTDGAVRASGGVVAYIFSERGIYRPGEKLNFGLIVKNGDFSPLPDDIPIWTEIIDPRGIMVYGRNLTVFSPGLAETSWNSPQEALSGKYIFNTRAGKGGELLGSVAVRIEDFLPDALKMRIETPERAGWVRPRGEEKIVLRLRNLYGTPAAGRKARASVIAKPATFRFRGFEEYAFGDPAPLAIDGIRRDLSPAVTGEEGEAGFVLPPDFMNFSSASIRVEAEGFD
nr:hypothetical protein [Desulfovibrio sp.]